MKRQFLTGLLLPMLFASMATLSLPSTSFADEALDDFNLGVVLFRKQRWDLAAETFGEFLKDHADHPRSSLAQLYYGLSLNSLEKYAPARMQLDAFIVANPTSPNLADARYRRAECSFYLQEHRVAIDQLSDYLTRHEDHGLANWARLMLGNSYNSIGDWNKAFSTLQALWDSSPEAQILPDTGFALGRAMEGQNRQNEAIGVYKKVSELKAGLLSARALARTGTIYFEAKDFVNATAAYDAVVADYGDQSIAPSASLQAGISQFQLKQYEQALMRLEKVPADSPLVNQTRMLKGLCLRELGQLDVARQLLADAYVDAGDSPLAAEILFQRAQIEQLDRKKDLASQMFLDLADRWPQDKHVADSLFNVAELKMELRDLDGAQRTLQRLNTDFPASGSEVRVKILQARILLSDRNPKEASQMLAAAIATEGISDRDRLLGSYHLIRAYHMARQFEQVVSVFEPIQAEIMQPSSSDFYGAIALAAMSSLELKQYEKAQKFADDFLRLESGSENVADGLAARAVASSQLKQFDKAKLDLQRLAKDYSENPQTWLALLQCAEAAWALEEFRFSAEFFEMAATRKEDVRVHEPALAGAAWSRYRLKQYDQAAEMFEQSANAYPKSAGYSEVTYMAGMSRYEEGKLPEAEALFKSAFEGLEKDVAEDPNHPDAKYAYDAGRMYAKLAARDPDVANQIWDRVVKTFAKSGSLDTLLDEWAYFNLSINNFAQSDAIYRRLLSDIPGSKFAGQARLSLAESDMLANRFDQALSEFQAISDGEAYRTQEKEAALYHVVDILAARREWPEVLASAIRFKEQFPTSPRVPKVRLFEAEALLDQKRLAEAGQSLQLLRQAVIENQISPEPWTERIWVVLADAALADKRYSDVDGFADELKQRVPDSVFQFQMQLTQGLRWKSQAEPDLEKARAFFKLVTQDPRGRGSETAARSQFLIAETFVLQNDLKSASKEYYRVLLYPFDEWRVMALFQAAGCEQELGNTEAAVKNYEDLIRDFPDSSLLEQAKERLATLKK